MPRPNQLISRVRLAPGKREEFSALAKYNDVDLSLMLRVLIALGHEVWEGDAPHFEKTLRDAIEESRRLGI